MKISFENATACYLYMPVIIKVSLKYMHFFGLKGPEKVELGRLANFEPFWYSRTFLKKFRKVENRAKKFPYFQAPKINCLRRDYPPLLVIFNSASVRVNYFLLLMVFLGKHAFFLWSKHEMFRWVGDIFGGIKMLTTYHRGYNSGQVL